MTAIDRYASKASRKGDALLSVVKTIADNARDQLNDAPARARELAETAYETTRERAGVLGGKVVDRARDKPVQTALIAFGVGALLAVLFSSRARNAARDVGEAAWDYYQDRRGR